MIYFPDQEVPSRSTWLGCEDCVWSGPEWLTTKRRLDQVYTPEWEDFFRFTVNIRCFEWRDCLAELENIKEKQTKQPEKVLDIYRRLMLDLARCDKWDKLR